jgi:hypothetical protein
MPFDEEVPICDYRTMDTKEFFNEFVVKHRPCLFKEYGRLNAAYNNWQNETYLREKASDHIIYAERQTNNRFAYYTEGAKRVYMTFGDFLDKFQEENKTYHYYYSFENPPGEMMNDYTLPEIMTDLFDLGILTYWHGYGTITRPHTDSMENMMCVFEGYKVFWIVNTYDRGYIYSGYNGYPDNYSPVEFYDVDYDMWPLMKHARVQRAPIMPGDCLYVPAYWFHQVESAPGVSIGVASFFKTYHSGVDLMQSALQPRIL